MKIGLLTTLFALLVSGISAQIYQVSLGAGYTDQVYYKLSNDARTVVNAQSWDIAFGTGPQDAAIFVNEASPSNMQDPAPEIELYLASSVDFDNVDTTDLTRLYNPDHSWKVGAANTVKSPMNPFDFGWGIYDPGSFTVFGNKVFLIKLRDGEWRKISFDTFDASTFVFKSAHLDGSDLQNHEVSIAGLIGQTQVHFDFATNSVVQLEPAEWDLQFARFEDFLFQNGAEANYVVTGVLHNKEVQVAEANGVDPTEVAVADYIDQRTDSIDVIGYDWKFFDLPNFEWVIDAETVYFILTPDNQIYQMEFLDFEGVISGTITFRITELGEFTSVEGLPSFIEGAKVFPNPTRDQFQLSLSSEESTEARIDILSERGQVIQQRQIDVTPGLNVYTFGLENAPTGLYRLSLQIGNERAVLPVQKIN